MTRQMVVLWGLLMMIASGAVTVMHALAEQPAASVTVTQLKPSQRLLAVWLNSPFDQT